MNRSPALLLVHVAALSPMIAPGRGKPRVVVIDIRLNRSTPPWDIVSERLRIVMATTAKAPKTINTMNFA